MHVKEAKGAVIKGLAFPIGYFIFMNVFQYVMLAAVAVFCIARDVLIPIASLAQPGETFFEVFVTNLNTEDLINYLSGTLTTELALAPTYTISILTSVIALVVLWFVFNRKGRDFKEYFGFRPAPVRSIIAAVLLGLGFFFLINAVMMVLSPLSTLLKTEWLIPMLRNLTEQLLQAGQSDIAHSVEDLADVLETSLNSTVLLPPLGLFTIAAVIFAPLIEEMIFRAGAISNLRKRLPMAAAILLSSVLFSLAHIGSLSLSQLIYTFILGTLVALLYVRANSIYPAIICHLCFNGANIVSLTLYQLLNLDRWQITEQGNQFVGPSYVPTPVADKLIEWYNVFTLGFTAITVVLSIPMLIIGIILLCKLRTPVKTPVTAEAPIEELAAQVEISDDACVISAEENEASEQSEPSRAQAIPTDNRQDSEAQA